MATVNDLLRSETCSDAHTCLVPNDQHNEESLTPGGYREIIKLKAVLSSDVSYLLKDTDTDKDMDTVNRVETMESPSIHLELSSSHHDLSGTYRVHMHQS